ncbi:PREDICTED: uncharacterized protein LOC104597052 [Nelumbo nucifera]|uniref:Uncharacterized protein LOC104597052 n=2 Tax=Nelumbo nucifera TaxID=4432 RepID=A0A1U7ZWT8_NELNU|nr:PREDICTED: uncharacterized protein LOC104597052 [Nelumbo nucifera]XP_010256744.1 PREDICTED: uncharacterized protein LOC104597052 [Nelumbo nucifera]DAD26582.1 TPA_asm: hypothetical protein HUJ06_028050 [Nelumbo nucifera]
MWSTDNVKDMGYNMDLKTSSKHHLMSRAVKEKVLSPQENRGITLRDRLKAEQCSSQSNIDLHCGDGGTSVLPKISRNLQKQQHDRKSTEDDELVKYMSNLPGYLQRIERGGNLQEKALNFGVLDWKRLEKWKVNQKPVHERSGIHPMNNTSSSYSTVGSFSLSSRNRSNSPAQQRVQTPSVRSHLNLSPIDGHPQGMKSSGRNSVDIQKFKTFSQDAMVGQQKLPRTDQFFGKIHSEIKLEKGKGKDSDPNLTPERCMPSLNSKNYEVPLCPKGKMKAQDGESENRVEQLDELGHNHPDQQGPGIPENITVLYPRGSLQNSCSGISQRPGPATRVEIGRKSFSLRDEVHFADLHSDIPYSCPLPCGVESGMVSEMKLPDSVDSQVRGVLSHAFPLFPSSHEKTKKQCKDKHLEKNKSATNPANSIVTEPSDKLGSQSTKAAVAKVRHPSPIHQPRIGRMIRSFSFKEDSAVPQLSSTYVTAKSGPVKSDDSACTDNSNRDKANANSRGRSSPLRRLLDPLLKPKATSRLHSSEPLHEESSSTRRACRSSDGRLDSSTIHPAKRNLNFSSCGPSNSDDSCLNEKLMASTIQALLHVTIKNGHPLFTFAVDNNSDILAATMKKVNTSVKDESRWNYTFYSISEFKKKSGGWMNQGSKGKNHGYISNVVGQMKVSSSYSPRLTEHNSKNHFLVNEFVLFGVELRHANQETPDFQPNSELAAMVVKVAKETTGCIRDGCQRKTNEDISDASFTNSMTDDIWSCNLGEKLQNGSTIGIESPSSAVVILPTGIHGMPNTGVPSSLIDRWKSGGSCDCGGWDLGCKLRILANEDLCNEFSSSGACPQPDRFDLFVQGGGTQNKSPVFSLAPFKKGIYSIDFNGSISLLQAFSICIAVLNSRTPCDLTEASNLFEAKVSQQEFMPVENDRIKAPSRAEPAKYVSYPPLSPVGRV